MRLKPRPKDTEKTALGRRIKSLRKERRLTQEDLAEKAGLDEKYIASIEQGVHRANPTLAALQGIARGLGLGLQDLFRDWGTEPTDKAPSLRRQVQNQLMDFDARRLMDVLKVVKALRRPR